MAEHAEDVSVSASQLWKGLSIERRRAAAEAFWGDEDFGLEHAQAVELIARQIKFRPRSAAALPVEKKARHLAGLTSLPESLAGRILVAYHLAAQRPMMAAFLDSLSIGHDNGLITDDPVNRPTDEKLAEAAGQLRSAHDVEDVALYFSTLLAQDPGTWGGLKKYV